MSLENVKVGDPLSGSMFGKISVFHVERLTPTMVIAGGMRFRRDGHQTGPHYAKWYLRPATESDLIKWRVRVAEEKLSRVCITSENLAAIEEFLSSVKEQS